MKLVVGLGNPGVEFENTRHNTGFIVLEGFRSEYYKNKAWAENKKFSGEVVSPRPDLLLLRPQTFMNNSGDSVYKLCSYYKIKYYNDVLVIHDDLDLLLGEFKLQKGAGAAGHHGVESIIEKLGTKDFWRLRVGIDSPLRKKFADDAKFVLEKFSKEEKLVLENVFDKALEVIESWLGK